MEFDIGNKKSKLQLGGYPTRLQLYRTPPNETVSLKEFEELAELRLKGEPSVLYYLISCYPWYHYQFHMHHYSASKAGQHSATDVSRWETQGR